MSRLTTILLLYFAFFVGLSGSASKAAERKSWDPTEDYSDGEESPRHRRLIDLIDHATQPIPELRATSSGSSGGAKSAEDILLQAAIRASLEEARLKELEDRQKELARKVEEERRAAKEAARQAEFRVHEKMGPFENELALIKQKIPIILSLINLIERHVGLCNQKKEILEDYKGPNDKKLLDIQKEKEEVEERLRQMEVDPNVASRDDYLIQLISLCEKYGEIKNILKRLEDEEAPHGDTFRALLTPTGSPREEDLIKLSEKNNSASQGQKELERSGKDKEASLKQKKAGEVEEYQALDIEEQALSAQQKEEFMKRMQLIQSTAEIPEFLDELPVGRGLSEESRQKMLLIMLEQKNAKINASREISKDMQTRMICISERKIKLTREISFGYSAPTAAPPPVQQNTGLPPVILGPVKKIEKGESDRPKIPTLAAVRPVAQAGSPPPVVQPQAQAAAPTRSWFSYLPFVGRNSGAKAQSVPSVPLKSSESPKSPPEKLKPPSPVQGQSVLKSAPPPALDASLKQVKGISSFSSNSEPLQPTQPVVRLLAPDEQLSRFERHKPHREMVMKLAEKCTIRLNALMSAKTTLERKKIELNHEVAGLERGITALTNFISQERAKQGDSSYLKEKKIIISEFEEKLLKLQRKRDEVSENIATVISKLKDISIEYSEIKHADELLFNEVYSVIIEQKSPRDLSELILISREHSPRIKLSVAPYQEGDEDEPANSSPMPQASVVPTVVRDNALPSQQPPANDLTPPMARKLASQTPPNTPPDKY